MLATSFACRDQMFEFLYLTDSDDLGLDLGRFTKSNIAFTILLIWLTIA